ncbi:MAG: glycosyltransferase, partial [Flavobacterium sp.]|nr:glycosyltransferase [Flavobacterium sp.]
MKKTKIVISGINMTEGGIFTILENCLLQLNLYNITNNFEIFALVPDKSKFNYQNINFIDFPNSKKSWFLRLYFEYFYFKKISLKLKPDIWFSLHDISPNVNARKRFVYCHNPNIFYKPSFLECQLDYKMGVFYLFYKFLYQINIKHNNAVFVQQNWIKLAFERRFKIDNVVVTRPNSEIELSNKKVELNKDKIHFFYPSFARTFKNFEIVFQSLNFLESAILDKINIHLTLELENQNKYTNWLLNKYGNKECIIFTGKLLKSEVNSYYKSIDCLIFPSKLETWGLPISEAKFFDKP